MAYITDLLRGVINPLPGRITVEDYVQESAFVTRYLSRVVKEKSLVVYQVLFHLSWFEAGHGEISLPWARVGSFIRSDQGNIVDDNSTVKRRLPDLIQYKCIVVNRQRGSANKIIVHLPSAISACKDLIDQEEQETKTEQQETDQRDYYTDKNRRIVILERDRHACLYCTATLSVEDFVLDHLIPVAKGGTNHKQNLVATCEACNQRRGESEPIQFLRENFRQQLLTQEEFFRQKDYIEVLLGETAD